VKTMAKPRTKNEATFDKPRPILLFPEMQGHHQLSGKSDENKPF